MPQIGSTEAFLEWGSDFQIDDTGDIMLAQDDKVAATATIQRLVRMLLTSPRLKDERGNFLAPSDDYFNPDYGAGLRAAVDMGFSQANLAALRSAIFNQLSNDPGVASTPSPVVNVTLLSDNITVVINVSFTTSDGQLQVLPTLELSPQGA